MARSTKKNAPLRFAVVGLGHIAQAAVLPAFRHARSDASLAALVSGDPEKLRKLGAKYKVPMSRRFSYDAFEDCLNSGEIDAVYIALPNHFHADCAVRALRKGIHVLCEKPMATSEADCRRMIDAAEETGAKLMVAYRLHFDPANLRAIRAAQAEIGELRYFHSSFSFQVRDRDNIRLQGEPGGGPLWDIGIYCINAARYFFRDEPLTVSALPAASSDPRFREVDEMVAVSMKFPGERLASFVCSFGAADRASYEVVGTKGSLYLEAAYEYAFPRALFVRKGEKQKKITFKKIDQFAPELIYFAECVRHRRRPEPSGLEGLADVRIIEALERSAQAGGRAIELPAPETALARKARPSPKQRIVRPPVRREPDVIKARSPSD